MKRAHKVHIKLKEENKSLIDKLDIAIEALESAKELNEWICKHISEADYQSNINEVSLDQTDAWIEMDDSMRNGLLASYRDQFEQALDKIKEKDND